jgi:hypothetical protein
MFVGGVIAIIGIVHCVQMKNRKNAFKLPYYIAGSCVVLLLAGIAFSSSVVGFAKGNHDYLQVEVAAGDTVWECVRNVYGNIIDIRTIVSKTIKINRISDGLIYPGEKLLIPTV